MNKKLFYIGLVLFGLYVFIAFFFNIVESWGYSPYDHIAVAIAGTYIIYFLLYKNLDKLNLKNKDYRLIFVFLFLFTLVLILSVQNSTNDFYHYVFEDVVLTKYGQNPFLVSPEKMPSEPWATLPYWQFLPTQHGPFRFFITAPLIWLTGGNIVAGIFMFKAILAAFILGTVEMFFKIIKLLKPDNYLPTFLLFAWNPLIITEPLTAGGSGIMMVFFMVAAFYFLLRKKFNWAIIFISLSVLIKYFTVILVPLFLIYLLKQENGLANKLKALVKYCAIGLATLVICFLPFWQGPKTLDGILLISKVFDPSSFPGLVALLYMFVNYSLDIYLFKYLFEAVFILLAIIFTVKYFISKDKKIGELLLFSFLMMGAGLLLGKYWFFVKYLMWLMPLIFLLDKKFYGLGVFLTGFIFLTHLSVNILGFHFILPTVVFGVYNIVSKQLSLKTV